MAHQATAVVILKSKHRVFGDEQLPMETVLLERQIIPCEGNRDVVSIENAMRISREHMNETFMKNESTFDYLH
jgi:hypothetical protein